MSVPTDFPVTALQIGTSEEIFVSHIIDPNNFYVQLEHNLDSLTTMMAQLQV